MKTADAISLFGSKSEIARLLGISKTSVQEWGDVVPDLRQFQLEELSRYVFDPNGTAPLQVESRLRPWLT